MGIMDMLMEYKFPIMGATSVAVALLSVIVMGPSLSMVVNFFWPLLVSTGFFLAAVAVLLKISPPETVGGQTGGELMDYMSGPQQQEGIELLSNEESEEKKEKGGDEAEPESESADHHRKLSESESKFVTN